jgi:hypothetical protein
MLKEADVNQKLSYVSSILQDALQGMQAYASKVRKVRGAVKQDFLYAALQILHHLPLKTSNDADIGLLSLESFAESTLQLQVTAEKSLQKMLQQLEGLSLLNRTARVQSAYLLMERARKVLTTEDALESDTSLIESVKGVCKNLQDMLRLLQETRDTGMLQNAVLKMQLEKALRLLQRARTVPGAPLQDMLQELGKKRKAPQQGHTNGAVK